MPHPQNQVRFTPTELQTLIESNEIKPQDLSVLHPQDAMTAVKLFDKLGIREVDGEPIVMGDSPFMPGPLEGIAVGKALLSRLPGIAESAAKVAPGVGTAIGAALHMPGAGYRMGQWAEHLLGGSGRALGHIAPSVEDSAFPWLTKDLLFKSPVPEARIPQPGPVRYAEEALHEPKPFPDNPRMVQLGPEEPGVPTRPPNLSQRSAVESLEEGTDFAGHVGRGKGVRLRNPKLAKLEKDLTPAASHESSPSNVTRVRSAADEMKAEPDRANEIAHRTGGAMRKGIQVEGDNIYDAFKDFQIAKKVALRKLQAARGK